MPTDNVSSQSEILNLILVALGGVAVTNPSSVSEILLAILVAIQEGGGGGGLKGTVEDNITLGDSPYQLTANFSRIVNGTGEENIVILPDSLPVGSIVSVTFDGQSGDIRPQTGGSIDGLGTNTSTHVLSTSTTVFVRLTTTKWFSLSQNMFIEPAQP